MQQKKEKWYEMLIKLEIDTENIKRNLEKIKEINQNVICVLKDDAYGLGIESILPVLINEGCSYFATAYIGEALKIKNIVKRDFPDKVGKISVMVLNYIEENELKKAVKNGIEITIFNFEQLEKYVRVLKNEERIKVHIKFNTGMNRLGFDEKETEKLIEKIKVIPNIDIISIYSHISNVGNEKETEKQIARYEKIVSIFDKNEVKYGVKHIQASPLLFKYKGKYNYDFARVGMAIYGMEPLSEKTGLYPVVKLSSKIINIRKLSKGEKVSYGSHGILKENKTVGVIPVGYAHGLQKQTENSGAYVLVNGKKAKILGEVCMDMIIVDVTEIPEVKIGSEAVITGKQGNEEITLLQMAEWAGTIQDDILTKWNKGIKRILV